MKEFKLFNKIKVITPKWKEGREGGREGGQKDFFILSQLTYTGWEREGDETFP
jgi:hypothetical protein